MDTSFLGQFEHSYFLQMTTLKPLYDGQTFYQAA